MGITRKEVTNTITIIDLESASTTCKNLPNFPVSIRSSIGGLGFQDKPMICGGTDYEQKYISNNCYYLEGNKWTSLPSINTPRTYAAVSPYPSKFQKCFVSGGYNGNSSLNTAEVLTEQGWETFPQSLPVSIYAHCSVVVNSTIIMVIGGFQNGYLSPSSATYFFNTEHKIWAKGPRMKKMRRSHSCGRIRKNSQSQELSIIVAGGFYDASVEILDLGSNEWRNGPDLPFGIAKAQMVEDKNGGVVLVGGYSDIYTFLDSIFQLSHGGEDAKWIKMEQKLKAGTEDHVAFLIPDNIVECS